MPKIKISLKINIRALEAEPVLMQWPDDIQEELHIPSDGSEFIHFFSVL